MGCPEWLRKDMKKSGQSKPQVGVKDMGSLFHKKEVKGYADGGEVEAMKQEGLKASAGEKVGFFERLRAGNIDDPNSEAYRRFGAGRGQEVRMQKQEDMRDSAMAEAFKNAPAQSSAPRTSAQDTQNDKDTAYDSGSKSQTFGSAFAAARKSGAKTFQWNGKSYTTEVKGQAPAAPASKPDLAKANEQDRARDMEGSSQATPTKKEPSRSDRRLGRASQGSTGNEVKRNNRNRYATK